MPGKIFVNYRRDDSAAHALNVAQYLERTFGARNVFLDVDRMRAGQDFPSVLQDKLSACKVMIAVIGPTWLTLTNDDGTRRLNDPEDWVRLEIAHALKRNVAVIPVLVGGAMLPKKSDLPDDLQPLLQRHVATITTNGFRNEMAGLVRDIKAIPQPTSWTRISAISSGLAAVLLIGLTAIHYTAAPSSWPWVATGKAVEAFAKAAPDQDATRKTDPVAALQPGAGTTKFARDTLADGKDCAICPEMVVVPAGRFSMGSPQTEAGRNEDEVETKVTIAKPFAVSRFPITFSEWDSCVTGGGCNNYWPADGESGRGNRPVINVNLADARAYIEWLSKKTGRPYRLLTEAEREYITRAGTTTPFWWGKTVTHDMASYDGQARSATSENYEKTLPVQSFAPNPWGLYNVHGNVWDWTEDCWNDSNTGNPGNGTARTSGDCDRRVTKGGSWYLESGTLRSAFRNWNKVSDRSGSISFRVARDITP